MWRVEAGCNEFGAMRKQFSTFEGAKKITQRPFVLNHSLVHGLFALSAHDNLRHRNIRDSAGAGSGLTSASAVIFAIISCSSAEPTDSGFHMNLKTNLKEFSSS